jgi:4-amino-4-deoxy-L-arabinose transferase-like glycosyltransferase
MISFRELVRGNSVLRLPILNALAASAAAAVGMFSFFAMGWLSFQSPAAVLLFGAVLSVIAVFAARRLASRGFEFPFTGIHTVPRLLAILAAGLALRFLWVALVPPVQISDFQDYLESARKLISEGVYASTIRGHVVHAFRPPGYPFALAGGLLMLGDHAWSPALLNGLLYIATSLMAYHSALLLTGSRSIGLWSAALLALWPSYIGFTGLAASEPLSTAMFMAVFWLFAIADRKIGTPAAWLSAAGAGLITGFGALVKPQMQMLPFLMFLYFLSATRQKLPKALNVVLAAAFMALALAPWAVRNYHQFGKVLIISSNGGDVFYRANNPLATGSYTERGERNLDPYLGDELEWSAMGYKWGKEWIRDNPAAFVKLGVIKVARFIGDDVSGAAWTLYRGHGLTGSGYALARIVSNAWWVLIWILSLSGILKARRAIAGSELFGLMIWMSLFFVVAHSVFESQSRYHMPMLGLLAILAGMGLARPQDALEGTQVRPEAG